jgi:prolyl 4-hydroxylase
MHYMLGIPLEQLEEPQIVRYQAGQEFSWHYDQVPPPQLSNGGQRILTLLAYLNTLPEQAGGETMFRDLKDVDGNVLSMRPVQGSVLLFFPADAQGQPNDRTLHKGQVVTQGYEKRIIQLWTHQRAFDAKLPANNKQMDAQRGMEAAARELGYIN